MGGRSQIGEIESQAAGDEGGSRAGIGHNRGLRVTCFSAPAGYNTNRADWIIRGLLVKVN